MKSYGKKSRAPHLPGTTKNLQDAQANIQQWQKVRKRLQELKAVGLCKGNERAGIRGYRLDPMPPEILLHSPDQSD